MDQRPLQPSNVVVWLSALIAGLALVAATSGLFWQGGDAPETVTTARGESVELYGEGLYRYDPVFSGAGNKGTDAVTILLGIPLLVVGVALYRQGSLHGGLLLMGALAWFLYIYGSYALFSASLFALGFAARSFNLAALPAHFSAALPERGMAIFLFISAAVTLVVWAIEPVGALVTGDSPESLRTWTTMFTTALDIGIIVPTVALAGWLVLRQHLLGYLVAFPLLVLEALLAPMIAAQTVSQVSAGVEFSTGEIIGPIGGFTTIAVAAIWYVQAIFRSASATEYSPARRADLMTGEYP